MYDVEDTGKRLGKGSYGEVVEMKLSDSGTIVAGKKLHDILRGQGCSDVMKSRIEQECLM